MFTEGTHLLVIRTRFAAATLAVGMVLLYQPGSALAQHGGGAGRGMGNVGGPGIGDRPSGVSPKDDLKDFHRLMALQASTEQRAMFARILEDTQSATEQLKALRELLPKTPTPAELSRPAANLQDAIETLHNGNQKFVASFSSAQKSGLKDLSKKLLKADSDLGKQGQELGHIAEAPGAAENFTNSASILDKALDTLRNNQLALATEMSIPVAAAGQDLAVTLSAVTNSIELAGQTIVIQTSGIVSPTSAEDIHSFSLKLTADLSDLQEEIASILRSQLNRSPNCGERVEIQRATLTPLGISGLLEVRVHFERWFCPPGQSGANPSELTSGDGSMEIRLTPAVGQNGGWRLASEIGRVDGDVSIRELLSSGTLGAALRDQVAAGVYAILQKGTDLKTALPPAVQESATIEKAKFNEDGAGRLSLVLEKQLRFNDEQAKQFSVQLKQSLSVQKASAP
jgi:hypothetical protein